MFINGLPDCNREGVQQKTGLICGRCAKDAQIFTSKSGTVIGSVSVAAYNKTDGTTVWMNVKGFGSMGRAIASASKGDLRETELRLMKEIDGVRLEIQKAKAETIKWVAGIITAQTVAIIAAIIALMK